MKKKLETAAEQVSAGRRAGYELYIVRHGKAVPRGEGGFSDDAKRPLTPEGRKELQRIARGMVRLGVTVDWIVSSPLVRAVETSEIMGSLLGLNLPLEMTEALVPGAKPQALLAFLAKHPGRRRTLVVGHEPGLSDLAATVIRAGPQPGLAFKKGGCSRIRFEEFPPQQGTLVWWATPGILRKLS